MALNRGGLIFLGLLVAACGLAGAHAVRPAGSTLHSSSELRQKEKSKSEEARRKGSEKVLDLRQFEPLLLQPELKVVRALESEEQYSEAAKALKKILSQGVRSPLQSVRMNYLLGRLYKLAAEDKQAVEAFERAAASDWPLWQDAHLELAEIHLRNADARLALNSLARLKSQAEEARALRYRALALDALGRKKEAVKAWKAFLASEEMSDAHMGLAQAYVQLAESIEKGSTRDEYESLALREAELAGLGQGPKDERAVEAKILIRKLQASGVTSEGLSLELQIAHLRALIEKRDFGAAATESLLIKIPSKPAFSPERCQFDYLMGKLLSGQRKWGAAADKVAQSAAHCDKEPELHAWLLFNAGKYSAADARHTKAVRFYAELEKLYPKNSLADDARLRAAKSYRKAGMTARFVSQLASLPEDYPEGDMTMEGVLLLALYRIERVDWSGAAQVLERAASLVRGKDSERGHEHSGTERYFLARAWQELGEEERALDEFESIIHDVPLSYYMLHAYSRLLEADPPRARKAIDEGLVRARDDPFEFPYRVEYKSPDFARGMELLRVGATLSGTAILKALGMREGADDALLWGVALLHDRAGDAHTAHSIARGRLSSWFAHYPEGDWEGPWKIGFPRPYHRFVKKESQATGVPEWLIYGVMREESTFRPKVVSHANAYGLMQIIPATARGIGKRAGLPYSNEALKRPSANIAIGSRVLKELGRRFKKNPWLAIPGYNAGPGRPVRWLRERPNVDFDVWVEMIPYRETRRYTKRVLASRAAYAFVYYRQEAQTALVLPKRLTAR